MWKSAATNCLLLSIASICFAQVDKSKRSQSPRYKVVVPPESLELDSSYEKYVNASGYPIVASGKVSDYALKEAAYIVDLMLGKRTDLRDAMLKAGSRLVVMSHKELTTDIPEHNHLKPKDYWDRRARGLGGGGRSPICSCAEENLLGFPGDPYRSQCVLIHEFAHNIHRFGLGTTNKTFELRLREAYRAAKEAGLWKDHPERHQAADDSQRTPASPVRPSRLLGGQSGRRGAMVAEANQGGQRELTNPKPAAEPDHQEELANGIHPPDQIDEDPEVEEESAESRQDSTYILEVAHD